MDGGAVEKLDGAAIGGVRAVAAAGGGCIGSC